MLFSTHEGSQSSLKADVAHPFYFCIEESFVEQPHSARGSDSLRELSITWRRDGWFVAGPPALYFPFVSLVRDLESHSLPRLLLSSGEIYAPTVNEIM
jgi:hypothetical protein